ncbi:MAG: (2Fe-2S)-binding protein [Ramlibacter sp.]|jgi:phenylpropionate dioxygenase-like ring-hydroxylating dioxygenase large terminal subunit|uniref:hypothetical protein n=1 Tax=Ramlibacter sp. TaxID=1917967 RepID=UPI002A379456|nr:(2Fe-2S)-binding protein [Ramlibacter sp.]
MIERLHWHPLAAADAVAQPPVPARLLGEDLVLWRDTSGAVHGWPDDEKLPALRDKTLLQDRPLLESQSPKLLPLELRAGLHTAADRASSAYRRYLSRLGITFGVR